jgi:hypothetical protein
MDAKPLSLGKIVSERQRFVVPIYQRTYSWTVKEQLQALFDQIEDKADERLTKGKVEFSHYTLICLIYDPSRRCANPKTVETDVERAATRLAVRAVICPQGL